MRHGDETLRALPERVRAAIEAQHAVAQAMHRATMPDWMHMDLTMGQLKTLMSLVCEGDMNVTGLAEHLEIGKPAASILVDRLVQLGYVERTEDTEDRRRTLVAPTEKGSELVTRLQQGGGYPLARWYTQMAADELEALTRGLRALAAVAAAEGKTLDNRAEAVAPGGRNADTTNTRETLETLEG
jgi:MarR family transcriptional regulator, organic hydroperoxide resistance regulator